MLYLISVSSSIVQCGYFLRFTTSTAATDIMQTQFFFRFFLVVSLHTAHVCVLQGKYNNKEYVLYEGNPTCTYYVMSVHTNPSWSYLYELQPQNLPSWDCTRIDLKWKIACFFFQIFFCHPFPFACVLFFPHNTRGKHFPKMKFWWQLILFTK